MTHFLHAWWFECQTALKPDELIYKVEPSVCVSLVPMKTIVGWLRNLDFKFEHVVGFPAPGGRTADRNQLQELFAGVARRTTIADTDMSNVIRASSHKMGLPADPVEIGH